MAKSTKARATSRAREPDKPWLEAIQTVLAKADGALGCAEIAERIIEKGLRRSVGATPAQTVASVLSTSVRDKASPFARVARGLYTLKAQANAPLETSQSAKQEAEDSAETGALRAFGMYWRRDDVLWSGTARLLGRQGNGASDVNFAAQIGVYLLHDRDRVIYVGRATDTLYARLRVHTSDRLSGRWDRFSWFGLKGVSDAGALVEEDVPWTPGVVIETMEALLIEGLEPPLNRRRGDNFSAVEFVQVADPLIIRRQKEALIEEMKKSVE
ncbi:MAG: hypothetical protein KKE02_14710 [Alphaproteobacteria bacterium]|nr:hypothetical protein [Alphaproteobacteria bacterium]MBU1513245.1 hypothetical protein [Alphaproteobacteria bacterium]MBU2095353.1 hypothetical protein [Alphaproteobacteria bacterium]MBU2152268.1 hypothetical protein [Alphaproteobacteria bacterium]MBU2306685.1 hypothetical protein [Alphaproteobacteria bacterium]